jgi:hypothetical protein
VEAERRGFDIRSSTQHWKKQHVLPGALSLPQRGAGLACVTSRRRRSWSWWQRLPRHHRPMFNNRSCIQSETGRHAGVVRYVPGRAHRSIAYCTATQVAVTRSASPASFGLGRLALQVPDGFLLAGDVPRPPSHTRWSSACSPAWVAQLHPVADDNAALAASRRRCEAGLRIPVDLSIAGSTASDDPRSTQAHPHRA